jgi:hypothetical protein
MPNCLAAALFAILVGAGTLFASTDPVLAQKRTPSLPPTPQPTSRLPQGAPGGSSHFVVSAAANKHGSFLGVVDSIEHVVTLCETDAKDFICTKKPLP